MDSLIILPVLGLKMILVEEQVRISEIQGIYKELKHQEAEKESIDI